MTILTTETLSRTEGLRRDEMREPDDVSAMVRLKALGWGGMPPLKWSTHKDMIIPFLGGP